MNVAICIATFRRPEGLERLIRSLSALSFREQPPEIQVIVVDNDAAAGVRDLCESLQVHSAWPIHYVPEPRRGIPFARNTAVRTAWSHNVDLIAFIDDDEVPQPEWLDVLLSVMREYYADIVTGPVLPEFDAEPPMWIRKGKFFERPRHVTGTLIDRVATGNVLVHSEVFKGLPSLFDERKALSGGTDTHFFLRAAAMERKIVWADEAIVKEWNPASRVNARWLALRAFRGGNTWATCEQEFHPSSAKRAVRAAKAFARIAHGVATFPLGLVLGRDVMLRSVQHVCNGAGSIASMAGVVYNEYRSTHGG